MKLVKSDFAILFSISIISLFVWRGAFANFFAQDDFIFIEHFSQNNFLTDLKNALGPPQVTHWRPVYNLLFVVAGNLFGKSYFLYHALILLLHILAGFILYRVVKTLFADKTAGVFAGIFYAVSPLHFVGLFWISGMATTIGFLFFILAFDNFIHERKYWALMLFVLAILTSEAMAVGLVLFVLWHLLKKKAVIDAFLVKTAGVFLAFVAVKFLFFTNTATFAIYKVQIGFENLDAIKYYLLRIAGFAETGEDKILSVILVIWWVTIFFLFIVRACLPAGKAGRELFLGSFATLRMTSVLILSVSAITIGLFPFILLPQHLSPHYMNISVWGVAMLIALALRKKVLIAFVVVLSFVVLSAAAVDKTYDNNWVVVRSQLAKNYLLTIERQKPSVGTTLVFGENSQEAYYALGQGRAIDFWFKGKNYHYCFTFLQTCPQHGVIM